MLRLRLQMKAGYSFMSHIVLDTACVLVQKVSGLNGRVSNLLSVYTRQVFLLGKVLVVFERLKILKGLNRIVMLIWNGFKLRKFLYVLDKS